MTSRDAAANPHAPFRLSPTWDIYVPFLVAAIPASLFKLLGLVTKGLERPGVQPAAWSIFMMVILQTLGIVALAFVVLTRFERGYQQLSLRTNGSPAIWRKLMLVCSIAFVLLFDILTNVAAAFAGADPLLVLAAPAFIGYIVCVRVSFARL